MDTSRILREVIIILLLILVIIFAFGILFYDCISADRDTIYSEEYIVDTNVSEVLDEISEDSGVDTQDEELNQSLKSYSVTQEDLENYAKEQSSYESGKKDPFAESSEETSSTTTVTVTTNNTSTNSQTTNSTQTNSNSEENTTTSTPGTFFEEKDSK